MIVNYTANDIRDLRRIAVKEMLSEANERYQDAPINESHLGFANVEDRVKTYVMALLLPSAFQAGKDK